MQIVISARRFGNTCSIEATSAATASIHYNQAAVPLAKMTAPRVTNLYDLMDAVYCSEAMRAIRAGARKTARNSDRQRPRSVTLGLLQVAHFYNLIGEK